MSQQKYTADLFSEFHCDHFTPVVTPLDPSTKFLVDMGEPLDDVSTYKWLVGKLNFLQNTRLDISF